MPTDFDELKRKLLQSDEDSANWPRNITTSTKRFIT